MIAFSANTQVYLALGVTDMRKSINGLMVLVEDVLQADPFSSHLFLAVLPAIGGATLLVARFGKRESGY